MTNMIKRKKKGRSQEDVKGRAGVHLYAVKEA